MERYKVVVKMLKVDESLSLKYRNCEHENVEKEIVQKRRR